jgi:hypothetical protein
LAFVIGYVNSSSYPGPYGTWPLRTSCYEQIETGGFAKLQAHDRNRPKFATGGVNRAAQQISFQQPVTSRQCWCRQFDYKVTDHELGLSEQRRPSG